MKHEIMESFKANYLVISFSLISFSCYAHERYTVPDGQSRVLDSGKPEPLVK